MKKTVQFRLDDDLISWLDERANKTRMNRSGILIQLIVKAKEELEGAETEAAAPAK